MHLCMLIAYVDHGGGQGGGFGVGVHLGVSARRKNVFPPESLTISQNEGKNTQSRSSKENS